MLRACCFAAIVLFFFAGPGGTGQIGRGVSKTQEITPAGDGACGACHAESLSYLHTAHKATSALATREILEPELRAAGPKLTIANDPLPELAFLMGSKDGRFTETAVSGWANDVVRTSEPIELVVGSGKRGRTFFYWAGNQLFELPVSYWKSERRWINSPGYVDGTADFMRPVQPGCLECHTTAIDTLSSDVKANSYVRDSLVPGIGCKTCHGPSKSHIAAETAAGHGAQAANAKILNPAHFSRDRQVDLCALCHSGIQRMALKPAFSYIPGEPLADFYKALPRKEQEVPDVHGNQVGLLKRSRCFLESKQMKCSTCHDVHTSGRTVAAYATKCLTCHQWQSCGESHRLGAAIQGKCVGCHMPVQQTNAIVSTTAGEQIRASMRTHWIKVYTKLGENQP